MEIRLLSEVLVTVTTSNSMTLLLLVVLLLVGRIVNREPESIARPSCAAPLSPQNIVHKVVSLFRKLLVALTIIIFSSPMISETRA